MARRPLEGRGRLEEPSTDSPFGGPVHAYIGDGGDVVLGSLADAAILSDVAGTVNAKLRGQAKMFGDVYDAVGGRLIVDASEKTVPISVLSLPLPAGAAQEHVTAVSFHSTRLTDGAAFYKTNSDVQLPAALVGGRLTVDASGVAVPVTDNAGSLTVDAPVGTPAHVRLSDGAAAYNTNTAAQLPAALIAGGLATTLNAVTIGVSVPVTDNAGSLTVDAPVGAPVFVRLSDGAAILIGQKTAAGSVPVVLASDRFVQVQGSVATDAPADNAPVQVGARAQWPTIPTAVSADGDVVNFWVDRSGATIVRPRQVTTYVAVYRLALAAASSSLAFTFTANTDKQLATIHHAVGATKRVTIRRVWVQIVKTGAVAGELQLELRQLSATTAPATGNPAITAGKRDGVSAAAEATLLALPTTAGSEVAVNSPIASSIVNLVASVNTAVGTGWVPTDPSWIRLYDEASADDEEQAPVIRALTAEGWAVVGRSTAAVPLNFIVRIVFTEE